MNYENLEISIKDYVATVLMTRTPQLNALTIKFTQVISQAFEHLHADDSVRVIILASKAKSFCVGIDLNEFANFGFGESVKASLDFPIKLGSFFECCNKIEACSKPVIAAVNGMCIGGGLDMISACDIRLCTDDCSFSLREAAVGIIADMGVLQRLPHIIGQGFTREMAFTAKFYTANEAKAMGLVNRVYKDYPAMMTEALNIARQISANAPLAVQATKEVLNSSRDIPIRDGITFSITRNMGLILTQDLKEAFASIKEKRKPDFKGK